MVAVAVRQLDKRFGQTVVLDGVDVEVPDGAFAVLVGPSGCGKSTLLRLIAGLEQPDSGSIHFGSREVSRLEPRERDVAMVFQSYALYPHLRVRDNLAFGLKLRKAKPAEIQRRVQQVSEMLGLEPLLDRMPRELSGGQRQRVAMGRAIARRPALFLFDEPLSNLDAALRAQVRVDIRRLHERLATTSIYVTHDQVEAMTLADVMFILHGGHVVQSGKPIDIYQRPATRFVGGFLGSPSMNFIDARLVTDADGDGLVAELGSDGDRQRLPIGEAGSWRKLASGQAVTVGLRPHDLEPCDPAAPSALGIKVTLTEALGGETYAHGELVGESVIVRLDPSQAVRVGERLPVAPSELHLFDPETGASLRC